MSALTRYPVPQAVAAGAVDRPRLYFRLEPTIVPAPVLDFLQPLRATKQGIAAGEVDDPRLYFRLEPTIVPDPVLEFLQPRRGLESIKAGTVNEPRLYFRLEPTAAAVAVTGGYTPYSVYDPRQERRIKNKRRKLRREREKLRADLALLVSGKPTEAPEPRIEVQGQLKPKIAPIMAPRVVRDRAAANAAALQTVAISARRARLEMISNELLALGVDLRAIAHDEAGRRAEDELIMILLFAS